MGFDIECIIDIHTYPGEYFCPVCRTLVYPNEAFQSQCTHLYCKPCLAHIANGTKACPYDGYLVTESDSKPLMDSDKALSENIGKVKVRCLYLRSGCTWEGTLSDCTAHCLGCSFGNSPVICNKCGIQIVHHQVHNHAQSCPGVYGGQNAVGGVSFLEKSGTISSTADVNQAVALSGAPPSQAQNPPNVTATHLPGQIINPQASAPSQAPAVAPVAGPTPEQMYQQQYQHYYQQYGSYDPYQQSNQQYYSVQQQPFQQYMQHPPQVLGQHQSHPYSHPQQSNLVPQIPQQPHIPQAQGQAQSQPQTALPQLPAPPQGQGQMHAPMQPLVPNYQVSSQQQAHPLMRAQTQVPPQTLPPPPQSQPTLPQPYGRSMGVQTPVQHPQVTQYQQPHVKMHPPQSSQSQVQPQMQSQAHVPQSSSQLHMHIQPQHQPQHQPQQQQQSQPPPQPYHTQPHHPVFSQANQQASAIPQAPQQPVPTVGGHHSYIHSQPPQKMHPGASHQHMVHPQVASGGLHPVQVHGEVQQHALMRPPSHGSGPHQHTSTSLAPQNQVPAIHPAPHQLFPSHAPQSAYPQHPPVIPPAQQALPHNYSQQQHFHAPFQSQLHQPGHLTLQQSTQTQTFLPGPPPSQSQNVSGRPVGPNQGIHSQNHSFLSSNFGAPVHPGPAQPSLAQPSVHNGHAESTLLEQISTAQETRSLSNGLAEKVGGSQNVDAVSGQSETVVKDEDINDNLNKPIIKQDENHVQGATVQSSSVKSSENGAVGDENREDGKVLALPDSLKQVDLDNQKLMFSKTVVTGPPSTNIDKQFHTAVSPSGAEGHMLPSHSHGSHQQRLQGPGIPHPGALNSTEGRVSGYFGPQGPAPGTIADPHGIMERAPPPRFEGQHGAQHVGRSSEILMSNNQMSGSAHMPGEGGLFSRTNADESSMNGLAASESSIPGSRDEKKALPREHLNPFPGEPMRTLGQVSSSLDRAASHGPVYDPAAVGPHSRFFPHRPPGVHGHVDVFEPGSEFGQHQNNHFSRRSPNGDYRGSPRGFGVPSSVPLGTLAFDGYNSREAGRFGEGSQPFNLPSDPAGNPFHDGRSSTMSDLLPRGNLNGPRNPGFGPGYLPSREPHAFPGRGHAGEFSGPGNFPRLPFSESIRGERLSFPHFGESSMMNNYSHTGFQTAGNFSGGIDSFDQSRKRKPASYGWCRICEIDCESVEVLDLHSQTREHQRMAMDIVKNIKMQNRNQHRPSAGHTLSEAGSRIRNVGIGGHGSKP